MEDNSFFVRESICPCCGHVTHLAKMVDGTPIIPQPGDVCICIRCAELLVFDKNMKLQKMSVAEINELQSISPETYLNALKGQAMARDMAKKRGICD